MKLARWSIVALGFMVSLNLRAEVKKADEVSRWLSKASDFHAEHCKDASENECNKTAQSFAKARNLELAGFLALKMCSLGQMGSSDTCEWFTFISSAPQETQLGLLQKICDDGVVQACFQRLSKDRSLPWTGKGYKKARDQFGKLCEEKNYWRACARAGEIELAQKKRDRKYASENLAKGCDADSGYYCALLSSLFDDDPLKKAELSAKACKLDSNHCGR